MKTLEERIEAAIREEVSIAPYDPAWPDLFVREKEFLRTKLPSLVGRIEHFGSTAVPGLAAKPIIDILVEVDNRERARDEIAPVLQAEGYDYFWRTDVDPPYPWFIKRGIDGQRTHHIHMVELNSGMWDRIAFRDYLREFPEEAHRYAELKRSLSKRFPHDRVAYTAGKTDYVVSATRRALERYKSDSGT